jgi:hypothetical protein
MLWAFNFKNPFSWNPCLKNTSHPALISQELLAMQMKEKLSFCLNTLSSKKKKTLKNKTKPPFTL